MGLSIYEISAYMRIASLAIASYDYLQTLRFELRMSRAQWRGRRLTLPFIFFFLIRYTSILFLTASNVEFFSSYSYATCQKYYLLPSIFKVLQTMVSQISVNRKISNRPLYNCLHFGMVCNSARQNHRL
ncbi:hypothetical protein DFH07DRAFT_807673 [Mycena maculata]|uniref:Uncharacterized protein n=1 Tax=Mycena maculata TaxID=230809 RepID=A0AAD7NNN2_9AGAR|nr:hypothetical protein DFH07DRAFT_807673 [Mycena maculata]